MKIQIRSANTSIKVLTIITHLLSATELIDNAVAKWVRVIRYNNSHQQSKIRGNDNRLNCVLNVEVI